jgi:hypothetical protein
MFFSLLVVVILMSYASHTIYHTHTLVAPHRYIHIGEALLDFLENVQMAFKAKI